MIGEPYAIKIRSLSSARCDVVFEIKPPVRFLTEESRLVFCENVLRLICRRADNSDRVITEGTVEITHNTPAEQSTIGYARIECLRYGSGIEIFTQSLLLALNGEAPELYNDGRAPWELES